MRHCPDAKNLGFYYAENMEALGLPVFVNAHDNAALIYGHVSTIAATLHGLGKGATVAELFGATFLTEKLLAGTAIYASYYVGASVGSLAVAAGRATSCGTGMIDLFSFVHRNNLKFQGWQQFFTLHPEIIRHDNPNRSSYRLLAKSARKLTRVA
jgi:hypothetical protein